MPALGRKLVFQTLGSGHETNHVPVRCIRSLRACACAIRSGRRFRWCSSRLRGVDTRPRKLGAGFRSEEHTSELQSLMRISYAVFCLKKKKNESDIEYTCQHHTYRRYRTTKQNRSQTKSSNK